MIPKPWWSCTRIFRPILEIKTGHHRDHGIFDILKQMSFSPARSIAFSKESAFLRLWEIKIRDERKTLPDEIIRLESGFGRDE